MAPEAVAEAYHAWEQGSQVAPLSAAAVSNQTIQESQRLLLLVRAYQVLTTSSCAALLLGRDASCRVSLCHDDNSSIPLSWTVAIQGQSA